MTRAAFDAPEFVVDDVVPLFWQTLWFRGLVVLALVIAVCVLVVLVTHRRLASRVERLEQRRALEQERARLAAVLERTSDYVAFTDPAGNLLYLNPGGRRLLGLSAAEDLRGRRIADFHPASETHLILDDGIPAAIRDGVWQGETALLSSDGREVPVSEVIAAHRAVDDTIDFVSTIARDISGSKRAEAALREAEEKYRAIFENSAEGIFQIRPDGRIVTVNPALARMLGYASPQQMLEEITDTTSQLYAEPARQRDLLRRLETEGAVRGFEAEFKRRDGSRVWFSKAVRVVHDAAGSVLYYEGACEDISDRRRARQADVMLRLALEKAAVEWERTFDALESPILILDGQRRIARLNRPAQQLAATSGGRGRVGAPVADVAPAEPWRSVDALAAEVVATGAWRQRQVQDPASGRAWDLSAGPSTGPGAEGGRVIVVARDVTRMVELQSSLRRSETMSAMGMLVAGVAHEVRNPLFSISANLDAFDAKMGHRPEFATFVTMMRGEVERLASLMRELLDYGKPVETCLTPESIASVVLDAARRCTALAEHGRVALRPDLPVDLPQVALDRNRLVQVFLNLLQNAIQHSPVGGEVAVSARRETIGGAQWLAILVTDAGPGFEPDDLGQVFMPFFSKRRGGTGLGLAVAQRIVEEHGGRISAENRPDGGALLTVRLPVYDASVS